MTTEQLGQLIKNKHPEYADLGDLELGQKMLAKYPQYGDMVDSFTPKKTLGQKVAGAVEKVGNFIGGTKLAKGIAGSIFQYTPESKELRNLLSQGKISQKEYDEVVNPIQPSNKEVIGSAVQLGATYAGLRGAGTTGNLLRKTAESATLGATMSAGKQMSDNETPTIGKTAVSAGLSASIPLLGAAFGYGFEKATNYLPKRFVQSVVKQPKMELVNGKNVAPYILSKKRIGTYDSLINQGQIAEKQLQQQIADALKGSKKTIDVNSIFGKVQSKFNDGGADLTYPEVVGIIRKLVPQKASLLKKPVLNASDANSLRQGIDGILGAKAFMGSQQPFEKEVLTNFNNFLRDTIQNTVSETRPLFSDLSKEKLLKTALRGAAENVGKTNPISFGDVLGAVLGTFGGAFGGGIPGAIAGFAVGKGIRSGVQSPVVLTTAAQGLNKLGNLGSKITPILEKLAPAERTIILNALKEGVNQF